MDNLVDFIYSAFFLLLPILFLIWLLVKLARTPSRGSALEMIYGKDETDMNG